MARTPVLSTNPGATRLPAERRRIRSAVTIAVAALLAGRVTMGSQEPTAALATTIDASVTDYLDTVAVPGVAVAVTHGDRVVLVKGYGRTAAGEPIDAHTPMAVASISKSITALAVMQLVEAGRVHLDRPVRLYLPELTMADPRVERITVRQLLNHTSGLSDRTFAAFSGPQARTLAERVASLRPAALGADPGSRWEYHNPNYQVAARLVEHVSGVPFERYLRLRVFEPIGMRDSRTIDTADDLPASATGHIRLLGLPMAMPEPPAFGNGSGGVLSSAHDMASWLILQQQRGRSASGATVVTPESVATMRTPSPLSRSYALGWTVGRTRGGSPTVSHSGDLFTATAQQIVFTDAGWGVAVMANTGLIYGDARAIAARIVDLIEGRRAEPAAAWPWIALDTVMLAWSAAVVLLAVRGVRRARTWGTRRAHMAVRAANLALLLVPLGLWLGMHHVVGFLYRGRDVAWIQVPYLFPSFMVLLTLTATCGVVVCGARLAGLGAARPPSAR